MSATATQAQALHRSLVRQLLSLRAVYGLDWLRGYQVSDANGKPLMQLAPPGPHRSMAASPAATAAA